MMVDDVVDEEGETIANESTTKPEKGAMADVRADAEVAVQAVRDDKHSAHNTTPTSSAPHKAHGEAATMPRTKKRRQVNMKNNLITSIFAVAMWLLIVFMNVASWVMMGLGN